MGRKSTFTAAAKRDAVTGVLIERETVAGCATPGTGAASVPRSFKAWDEFVEVTVERYAGQITAYQIWNEASLGGV